VAELRRDGRTPKEIARALGLKPAQVTPLIRAVGAVTPSAKPRSPDADVWCLGVKNCNGPKTMDRRKLPDFVSFFFRAFSDPPVPAPLELARHDMFRVMAILRKTVGDGNFHYLCQIG
jgi:hypothetical protein